MYAIRSYYAGFLVREDVLVTAGHCLQKVPCSDTSIVFGFQMEAVDSLAALTDDNVFKCTEVIAQVLPSQNNHRITSYNVCYTKLLRTTARPL